MSTSPPPVAEPLVFKVTSLSLSGPLVTTFPNWSRNCTVTVIGASTVPSVGFKITNFAAASCVTVNDTTLPPVPLVERLPSLAVNVTGPSALYPTSVPPAEFTHLGMPPSHLHRVASLLAAALCPVAVADVHRYPALGSSAPLHASDLVLVRSAAHHVPKLVPQLHRHHHRHVHRPVRRVYNH